MFLWMTISPELNARFYCMLCNQEFLFIFCSDFDAIFNWILSKRWKSLVSNIFKFWASKKKNLWLPPVLPILYQKFHNLDWLIKFSHLRISKLVVRIPWNPLAIGQFELENMNTWNSHKSFSSIYILFSTYHYFSNFQVVTNLTFP